MSGIRIRDTEREPHPDPCRDCGRTHLRGERVSMRVPTTEPNGMRVVWEGCVDCWVLRTSPAGTGGTT